MTRREYWWRRARAWWMAKLIVNRARNLKLDIKYFGMK